MNRIASTFNYKNVDYPLAITFSDYVEETVTWQSIYFNGRDYYKAGIKCLESKENRHGGFESLALPSIVTYLFSIELFLKSLYVFENGSTVRGHEIKELYESLSAGTQELIKSSFETIFQALKNDLITGREAIVRMPIDEDINDEIKNQHLVAIDKVINITFVEFLLVVNNFFVKVRYDFEKRAEVNYMDSLIWVLATVLFEMIQDKLDQFVLQENRL